MQAYSPAPLGDPGWAPGLVAAVDQHASAVRELLEADGGAVTPAALREYRDGFVAAALGEGWHPREPLGWRSIRILTVQCMIDADPAQRRP